MTKTTAYCQQPLHRLLVAAVTILLAAATVTAAQTPPQQPPADATENLYRWISGTAAEQLAADPTVVPAGMGAVFVPAMSRGIDEPEVVVLQNEVKAGGGPTGRRIVLAPGSYVVRVGSAPLNQMVSVPVVVTAGNTAMVPVEWGALVISVVDRNNVPHRGAYELIQVSDRQPYVVGFGADTLQGESIRTLLVGPGLYRIVRQGANYRARTDFSTVVVPKGGVVYYKLVLDPDDGRLLGAGVVPPEELGIVDTATPWSKRFSVGFGVPIVSTSNVVGTANQRSVAVDFTFDTNLTYNKDKNYFGTIFEVEQGAIRFDPESGEPLPIQKTIDRLRFDTLYTRFFAPRIGPYVRFGLLTNLFESRVLVTEPTIVQMRKLDGTQTTDILEANEDFKIGDPFAPVLVREGAGVNVRLVRARFSSLDWRFGFGLRQNQYRGAFVLDDETNNTLLYSEVESFNQEGLETTIVGTVNINRLLLNTSLDLFGDFNDFGEPTLDWRNTFSFRLTGALSVDYRIDVLEQPQVTDETQLTQSLQFRLSWGN